MCGIAGIAGLYEGFVPDMSALHRMCDSIVHRGPDDEGFACIDSVALGMRRLSIIDVEGGAQPIYNEDRSICVTLNGEIYNYRELRKDLKRAGHRFATQSDTEVLVHAYEEYGIDFLGRLNGMFALALHDARRRQVVLARDPMGIKPLFYSVCDEAIVWGSEIKAVLASGLIDRTLNAAALLDFLAWEYVPGGASLFEEVAKLQAGHYLVIRQGAPIDGPNEYWDIPTSVSENRYGEDEWLERLDAAIGESVRRQLVSDVPLGAFLSGGVDSSLIVAAMGTAKTFSIGFDDPSYNELPYSEEVARHLGTDHSTQVIKPHVADLFDQLMAYMDDPIGDFSIFPTYLVSKLARKSVTVSLSGDGGDELFSGYETYAAQKIATHYERLPDRLRRAVADAVGLLPITKKKKGIINKTKRFIEGCGSPIEMGHARWRLFLPELLRRSLFTPEIAASMNGSAALHIENLFARAGDLGPVSRCLYVDAKSYLIDNCLVKVDRMSMANSLEVRVPFLDTNVVELAFSMPDELKLRGHQTKYLLKKLAVRYIPSHCVYRPKEGFSIPIKNWLAGQFRDALEEYTNEVLISSQGIFDAKVVSRLKSEHLAGNANHSHTLWSLIVFNAWYRRWLMQS